MEPQDVALVGQQVVADAQASHGGEVAPDDPAGHVGPQAGRVARPFLDGVKDLRSQGLAVWIGRVEIPDPRVQVPAVVVEAAVDPLHLRQAHLLEVDKPHHDVGDLDTRVVDVVLDADLEAPIPEQADEAIAETGVSEVPDVGRLVGVDAGVLDDDLAP
jgi:hypothetical protein